MEEVQMDQGGGEVAQESVHWGAGFSPEASAASQKFESPEAMAIAYDALQGHVSKKVADYTESDWVGYSKMQEKVFGIPTEVGGYRIDPDVLSEGQVRSLGDVDIAATKDMAYRLGLNNDQAQQLYNELTTINNNMSKRDNGQYEESLNQAFDDLEKSWGGQYKNRMDAVDACMNNVIPRLTNSDSQTVRSEIARLNIATSPVLMKFLSSIGEMSNEKPTPGYGSTTPASAQARLDQMKQDPDVMNALWNDHHPRSKSIRETYSMLNKIVHNEQ